jgi:hypothetical protein
VAKNINHVAEQLLQRSQVALDKTQEELEQEVEVALLSTAV